MPFWSPYHMSKWALQAFSDCLRRELLPLGVRVAVIQPGAIASRAFTNQLAEFEEYRTQTKSEFSSRAVRFLKKVFVNPSRKEKDPKLVVDAILHAIYSKRSRPYYQPGRRLVPDLALARLPRTLVDRFLMRI